MEQNGILYVGEDEGKKSIGRIKRQQLSTKFRLQHKLIFPSSGWKVFFFFSLHHVGGMQCEVDVECNKTMKNFQF